MAGGECKDMFAEASPGLPPARPSLPTSPLGFRVFFLLVFRVLGFRDPPPPPP